MRYLLDILGIGISRVKVVRNREQYRSADSSYQRVRVRMPNGKVAWLLFTDNAVDVALRRAINNPEDLR